MGQYGPPHHHTTEEARSRFLTPVFNVIVPHFRQLLSNTPEGLIEAKITTKGRIEYQFRAFGGVILLFMEVKLALGTANERMNAIAQVFCCWLLSLAHKWNGRRLQVLAEGDACDYENFKRDLKVPIFGILTDGSTFQFFRFTRNTATRKSQQSLRCRR